MYVTWKHFMKIRLSGTDLQLFYQIKESRSCSRGRDVSRDFGEEEEQAAECLRQVNVR